MRQSLIHFARQVFAHRNIRLQKAERISATRFPEVWRFFEAETEVRAPNIASGSKLSKKVFPVLRARKIRNGQVTSNRRCSGVIHRTKYLLPQSSPQGPWNLRVGKPVTGGIIWQKDAMILIDTGLRKMTIDKGIFVGTWAPHNWFHWTIDILPSVWLSSRLPPAFDDYPLLLPAHALEKATWREPFDLVSGSRPIVDLSDARYTNVRNLIWIDSPTSPGPLALHPNSEPRFSAHGSALNAYREHVLRQLGLDERTINQSSKIFLARKNGGNRPYNQDELIEVAKQFDFQAVFLEDMPLKNSIQTMLEAKAVIGPHGAGWASALYCQKRTKGFLWTWEQSRHDNWFANVASVRQMRFEVSTEMEKVGSRWRFEPAILAKYLEQSVEN